MYFKQLCELPHIGLVPHEKPKARKTNNREDEYINCLTGRSGYWSAEVEAEYQANCGAPWFFVKVAEALRHFIKKRQESLGLQIAETEITRLITRWIVKSRNTREPVMIIGNSRFGKTETTKLYAKVNPEACRLVDTREGNALSDLLGEVAKALGIKVALQNSIRDFRDQIDYVLRYSKLQPTFKESQFLLPASYFSKHRARKAKLDTPQYHGPRNSGCVRLHAAELFATRNKFV